MTHKLHLQLVRINRLILTVVQILAAAFIVYILFAVPQQAAAWCDGRGCGNPSPCPNGNSRPEPGDKVGGTDGGTKDPSPTTPRNNDDDDRPPRPTVNLSASPTVFRSIDTDTIELNWTSRNATRCSLGDRSTSGSVDIFIGKTDFNGTRQYSVTCTGRGGSATDRVSVRFENPLPVIESFRVTPTYLWPNEPYTLSWRTREAETCEAANAWSGMKPVNGSEALTAALLTGEESITAARRSTPAYADRSIHTLTCSNYNGVATRNVSTYIMPPTLILDSEETVLVEGEGTSLTWSVTPDPSIEPDSSCVIEGTSSGRVDISSISGDTLETGPIQNQKNFVLRCEIYGIEYTAEHAVETIPQLQEI